MRLVGELCLRTHFRSNATHDLSILAAQWRRCRSSIQGHARATRIALCRRAITATRRPSSLGLSPLFNQTARIAGRTLSTEPLFHWDVPRCREIRTRYIVTIQTPDLSFVVSTVSARKPHVFNMFNLGGGKCAFKTIFSAV